MSIKSIKQTLWFASGLLTILLFPIIFMTFFMTKADAQKIPELPDVPEQNTKNKKDLINYAITWNTDVNSPAPKEKTVIPPKIREYKAPSLESILPNYLQIHSILSENLAIITIKSGNKDEIIRIYDENQERLFNEIGDESQRPWEVVIPGKKLIVLQIARGKGILFKTVQGNEKVWLQEKRENDSDNSIRKIPRSRQLGENHWIMTSDEVEKMYEEYDKYIGEMGLVTHSDGIWVRRVPEQSKAEFYGLQKNDIVTDFNGARLNFDELASKQGLRKFARKFSKVNSFRIGVIRNGKKVQLRFDRP